MIDENKLIEELEDWKEESSDTESDIIWNNAINQCIREVKRQPKVGEWIPVEEGLPEERDSFFAKYKGTDLWKPGLFEKISDEVEVTCKYYDGTLSVKTAKIVDGVWDVEKERTIFALKVIAWKPRPEPYRKEDNK